LHGDYSNITNSINKENKCMLNNIVNIVNGTYLKIERTFAH